MVSSQPNRRSVQRVGTNSSGAKCREEIKFCEKLYIKGLSPEIDFKKLDKLKNLHNPPTKGKKGPIPEEIYQTLLTNRKQGNLD